MALTAITIKKTTTMIIANTPRLTLRLVNIHDAEFIFELLNDPSWIKHIGDRGITDLERARTWINDGPLKSQSTHGFSFYVVTLKESGVQIGLCGLVKREVLPNVDIGYAFLPRYWGQGYAEEAAIAIVHYAHAQLGIDKLAAITSPENASSNKLLKKLGFDFEDEVMLMLSGEEKRCNLYGYAMRE